MTFRKYLREYSSKINTLSEVVAKYESLRGVNYLTLNGSVHDILWGMDDPIMKILYSLKLAPSPQLALQVSVDKYLL